MRQVLALVAGALLAALGAVVLGEYPLQGATAVIGFPLYGVAVAELALAVGKRLSVASLVVVAAIVGAGLAWALWISFGHFRNDVFPPTLSWVMVGAALLAAVAWGWPRRRSGVAGRSDGGDQAGGSEAQGPAEAGAPAGGRSDGRTTAGHGGAANGGGGGGGRSRVRPGRGGHHGGGPGPAAPADEATGGAGSPARGAGPEGGDGDGGAAARPADELGRSRARDEEVGP